MTRLIVHPRSSWTTHPARITTGIDSHNGITTFRTSQIKGVRFVQSAYDEILQNRDPAVEFRRLFSHDFTDMGHGDITCNLGVAGGVQGVWNLRGLSNKPADHPNSSKNCTHVSVYVLSGTNEKPTDVLLRNILDARRLVVSRYPMATGVDASGLNAYLQAILGAELPVGEFSPEFVNPLPPYPIYPDRHDVHVQSLQDQLAYWGYYRVRSDGWYGPLTVAAVKELQADLIDYGYYNYPKNIDGLFEQRTHNSWLRFIKDLW